MLLLFSGLAAQAIETHIPSQENQNACTVRFSSQEITASFSGPRGGELGFCSGTLIDSTTLVTAAHCLNEAFATHLRDLGDIPERIGLNLAAGEAAASADSHLAPGNTAVYSDGLRTKNQRADFISQGDIAKIREDVVILKLSSPAEGVDESACPQLPSAADCAAFEGFIADTARNNSELGADFYYSRVHETGSGASKRRYTYPGNALVNLAATAFSRNAELGFLSLQFNAGSEDAALAKGDSGTGLIWRKDGKTLLMGVQSATAARDHNRGFFAGVCALQSHPNWPAGAAEDSVARKPARSNRLPASQGRTSPTFR